MKNLIRHSVIALGLLLFSAAISNAAETNWLTDLSQAQAEAKAGHKNVLLFFHGSDWCPLCIEMEKQVFQTPEFAAFAKQNLVLVDVNFPNKTAQPEALKNSNKLLKEKFNVGENFPTLVLLNESLETVYQETGYSGGGLGEVLPKLQHHLATPAPAAAQEKAEPFKTIPVAEFAKLAAAADKQTVLLDVRTREEFAGGHLAGATNIDYNSPDFMENIKGLNPKATYLVNCASGVRSARACDKLSKLGFANLYNLSGGFKAWARAGQPIEK